MIKDWKISSAAAEPGGEDVLRMRLNVQSKTIDELSKRLDQALADLARMEDLMAAHDLRVRLLAANVESKPELLP